jgi:diguanylate cyclase (GGDEF)-like protein
MTALRAIVRTSTLRVLLILASGVASAALVHDTLDRRADAVVAATFDRLSEATLVEVQGVMDDYETRLGMIAVFAASREEMPPEVWARFVRSTGILSTSSDAGIGYIEMVPAAELPEHIARETAYGRPSPIPVVVPERLLSGSDLYVLTRAVSDAPGFPELPSSDLASIPTVGAAIDTVVRTGELQTFSFGTAIREALALGSEIEAQGFDIGPLEESLMDLTAVMSASPGGILVPVVPVEGGRPTGLILAGSLPTARIGELRTRVADDLVVDLGVITPDGDRVMEQGGPVGSTSRHRTTLTGSIGGIEWFAEVASTPALDGSSDRAAADVSAGGVLAVAVLAALTLLVRRRLLARSATTLDRAAAAERSARTDRLTGLLNRVGLDVAIATSARHDWPAAVVFVDLDGLKAVNDAAGHEAGDELLRTAARRLRCAVRATDLVARLGGDEFVVVAAGIGSPEGARELGATLLRAVTDRERDPDAPGTRVSASMGVAVASDVDDAAAAIRRADAAMYTAKELGGDRLVGPSADGDAAGAVPVGVGTSDTSADR